MGEIAREIEIESGSRNIDLDRVGPSRIKQNSACALVTAEVA